MRMNLLGVLAISVGIILIYAGITKKSPLDIIKQSLTNKGKAAPAATPIQGAAVEAGSAVTAAQKAAANAVAEQPASTGG